MVGTAHPTSHALNLMAVGRGGGWGLCELFTLSPTHSHQGRGGWCNVHETGTDLDLMAVGQGEGVFVKKEGVISCLIGKKI
ncbi:MAG: hypothetical protein A2075_08520 [Geobacteraceae bacterium GWC2_58_44]|nr:MAG: hypothetical protein A2075_08520 [Geobacteraceae bacterium GWC2_58_44]